VKSFITLAAGASLSEAPNGY